MSAKIINGKEISEKILQDLQPRVAELTFMLGRKPGLSVILVGENQASLVYVSKKEQEAKKLGIESNVVKLPADCSQLRLVEIVRELNRNPNVDGIIIQLPLPAGLNSREAIEEIDPSKDVDGMTSTSLGRMMAGLSTFKCCTPLGVMKLIDSIGYDLKSKKVAVVGASAIVGKPLSYLLMEQNATVSVSNIYTDDLKSEIEQANVVIVAAGKPNLIRGSWVKYGSIVIDIGINRVNGKIVGDVEFDEAIKKAAYITPVPGGVGPMTVSMLLYNTVCAASKGFS